MTLNLTNELNDLLLFTGDVACAIRLYSAYTSESENNIHELNFNEIERVRYDLMYLSDTLHYFTQLHYKIMEASKTESYQGLILSCNHIILQYENYQDEKLQEKFTWNAIATFKRSRNADLVNFDLAVNALKSIIEKCSKMSLNN